MSSTDKIFFPNDYYTIYCHKIVADEIDIIQPEPNTVPYASIYTQDALLPTGASYSGVFPINSIGSGSNISVGFKNNANGNIELDQENQYAKEGSYHINWSVALACDNITNNLSIGNGEIALLVTTPSQPNAIYGRQGIGSNGYASKPGLAGANSRYVTISGSTVVNLSYGQTIGVQALSIINDNQYKYNITFTATYVNI